jgi:indolepyruvate ferredoxin oxidoreductase, beta subunit
MRGGEAVRQQIIISGTGGQGGLFITRVLAESAMMEGLDVLTSETHGMAMRGGTVISHVKVGPFQSPLIRNGQADVGLFLNEANLVIHGNLMKPAGMRFVNTVQAGGCESLDATAVARKLGAVVTLNLVMLGFAAREKSLFCGEAVIREAIRRISNPKQVELNMKGFEAGLRRDQ